MHELIYESDWIRFSEQYLSYPFQKNTVFCSHCQLDSESYTFRSNMKTYLKPQTKAAGIEEHQAIPMIALCCGVFSRFTGNTNTSFDFRLTTNTKLETLQHIYSFV